VESSRDIEAVRAAAREMTYEPLVIAKIERSRALVNLDDILQAADVIMVARGDLGVEVPIEQVAILQKEMIQKANLLAKPVITATQMLESMTGNRRPTRAEVSDVTNAILDGSDAIMLSGETAIGAYPVETVQMMTRIAQQAEAHLESLDYMELLRFEEHVKQASRDDLFSLNIKLISETMQPRMILVPSLTGATARRVARFRMPQWIIAGSHLETTCQRLQFSWGVHPRLVAEQLDWEDALVRQKSARRWCEEFGIDTGLVILIEGAGTLRAHDTRRIDIVDLG
jgi:pyruvate kinase